MVSSVGRSGPCREAVRRGGCLSRLRGTAEGASPVARRTMQAFRKALIVGAVLGAGAGVGSALFVLVTPGEERIQAMLKEMPGQDPRSREQAARNKQLVLATLQEAAATQENLAWRKKWMGSGGGRSA
ncbi:ubiquinol-cytochrome-c reductase complex assembly factor 3 [Pteropus vampyrus]|uniref:Ubiquinol-cytochrome-c reductase complex assembly factor 3 n=2 Tax=Pteropus TaxID=9401 RepID=A0A6P3QVK5_PTEVA|nr:ubiquinol-cytochrome-c reductase complex assembly factor 3 [Pteropus vampyrus]